MRLAKLSETNVLNHLHQTDKARLQAGRQSLDLGIYSVIKGFDRLSHICYIANML